MILPQRTKEKPALAVSLIGFVNGFYYPIFDIDGVVPLFYLEKRIQYTQMQSGLHTAHVYHTKNGWQVRFYYDHRFTLGQVREIMKRHMADMVDENYLEMIEKYMPSGRATGKHAGLDVSLVCIVAEQEGLTEKQQKIGDSLAALFNALTKM